MQLEHIDVRYLKIPFNVSFRHASAERDTTATVWVEAHGATGKTGMGESCPRSYVTGETPGGAMEFITARLDAVRSGVHDVHTLRAWLSANTSLIDCNPAACCALELALLDLLGHEQQQPVEALLGLEPLRGPFRYTAVLGDSEFPVFREQLERYLKAGFSDFKIKLSGLYDRDSEKLALFGGNGREASRLRLDANNLWDDWRVAADYLGRLPGTFTGIEEPLAANDYPGMENLFRETGIPVILDESLLRAGQVAGLAEDVAWRINLRVSKMGGLLRSLDVLEAARQRDIRIIAGAQVGETSLLTRAGMSLAGAAGDLLEAQEGGFGTHLLSRDICEPLLMFGPGGRIDEAVARLAGRPGFGLVRAGDTDKLLSMEP